MINGKRITAILLIVSLTLPLVSCKSKPDRSGEVSTNTSRVDATASLPTESSVYATESSVPTISEETVAVASEQSSSDTTDATYASSSESETSIATSITSALQTTSNNGLTDAQRNSINMLNYMTSLTQKVNVDRKNQITLESVYNSFDNLYPNSVDKNTQAQVTSLMDTIQGYRMISVKRDRLEFIYEQNQAQAYRKAIPNPMGLLSAVQSGSKIKMIAAVIYMVADSVTSYTAAKSQADLEFVKDGWELDDEEANELHNSTKSALNYMLDMVRNYDIPGDYALSKEAVENFVLWSNKPDSQLERKISWFESNKQTYTAFGPYWLELAKDYYNNGNYEKCLDAVQQYESISTRIFRKDKDYANILPMAIVSAKETLNDTEYVKLASDYCAKIHDNTKDKDWSLRYFVAQVYMNLYAISKDRTYIEKAYEIARENVNYLVDEQKKLNATYLADVEEVKPGKDATKHEKKEMKQYNKSMKAERKTALPPVSEALYLNAELLFGLAKEKNISASDQNRIERILHENGENIFLAKALDELFWFTKPAGSTKASDVSIDFDGGKIVLPASCITDRSKVIVTVTGSSGTKIFENWEVTEVKRPKNAKDCSEYRVTLKLKEADKYKYQAGETVIITIIPVEEAPSTHWDYKYSVVETKTAFIIKGIKFERAN